MLWWYGEVSIGMSFYRRGEDEDAVQAPVGQGEGGGSVT